MIDKEKVIRGLECCLGAECQYCEVKIDLCEYLINVLSDALALLKGQEGSANDD